LYEIPFLRGEGERGQLIGFKLQTMIKRIVVSCFAFLFFSPAIFSQVPVRKLEVTEAGKGKINTRIDNIKYWKQMVKLGYVKPNPKTNVPKGQFTGSLMKEYNPHHVTDSTSNFPFPVINSLNSPDIPVTNKVDITQSENSIFIDPKDESTVLNSNNSTNWINHYAQDPYGADALHSSDGGTGWAGSTDGVNGSNSGDPSVAIGTNGWWYVGKINADFGQSVSYSKNKGKTWTRVNVADGPTVGIGLLDKNHLWIDNSSSSPFKGYLYDAWTNFIPDQADTNQIEIVRSTDFGLTWSSPHTISTGVSALKFNHGVNIQTGPDGEVYVAWIIYDEWPSDETAIGFTRSFDGGGIFAPATRILSNIKGIRTSGTGKYMRVNSFPSMAVDNSTGPNRGTIYLTWTNIGVPGINTGTDIDIYLIKSTDQGNTWSTPIRINQDPSGLGKQHFFPWITCDPVTGGLCVIYYDDRNLSSTEVAAFVSYSYDGGMTWTDSQVSDYTWTPAPIPGLAYSYFGDYLGIQSYNMKVYPVWTSNHDGGRAMTYVSPFDLGPNPNQPWIIYNSCQLTSIPGGIIQNLNFGDSLHLSLGLKNVGDQPGIDITAFISCSSPYVLLTDTVESYGTMDPGEVKVVPNGFTIKVSDTIPDNQLVRFNVRVTSSDSVWYSHFSLEAHAPALKITKLIIIDTVNANHNGRLDPGETVQIIVYNSNTGDFPSDSTCGKLSTTSPYLTLEPDSILLGSFFPGDIKKVVFSGIVSEEAPTGSAADLSYLLTSGNYRNNKVFREIIGQAVEDWETNTFTHFNWQSGGTLPWTLTSQDPYEGMYAAQSGMIEDYQNSQLFLNYTAAANDSISFYLKTSSEQDYDYMIFSIDNVYQGQWSGDTPWTRAAFPVSAGPHLFKWIYFKDLAFSYGLDRVWIDFIALPPPLLPFVDPGPDDTICAGEVVALSGIAQPKDSIKWATMGDGLFFSDTSLFTTYYPGTQDLISGSVILRLTACNNFGSSSKNKHIQINPRPFIDIAVYPQDTVCSGNTITLTATSLEDVSYLWTPGNFSSPEVIFDTAKTGGIGSHQIFLRVTSPFNCVQKDSVTITFKNCTGLEKSDPISTVIIIPNPNNGKFQIVLDRNTHSPIDLKIINSSGSLVFYEKESRDWLRNKKFFNLSFLPDGIYLLSLASAGETRTCKLIIQK